MSDDCLALIEAFISERISADAARADAPVAVKRLSVLVVDDDASCQKLASAPFRARGDYVRIANDGFEALGMCLKEPPDIILSDVNMPRMDGWQLLRMIRTRPTLASIPVIFTTTLSGEEERLKGYQLGVDDYVPKPYRSIELRARVDRLAARMQQQSRSLVERKTLRGDLQQVSLPSVLAFLEMEQKTGELLLLHEAPAKVFLVRGRPVHVEIEGAAPFLTQEELIFSLLGWTAGQFEFAVRDVTMPDELDTTFTALLLEHARRHDEQQT
jgi:CheY-like chemotaxis protein